MFREQADYFESLQRPPDPAALLEISLRYGVHPVDGPPIAKASRARSVEGHVPCRPLTRNGAFAAIRAATLARIAAFADVSLGRLRPWGGTVQSGVASKLTTRNRADGG